MPGAIGAIDGIYLPWIAPTTTNDFITRKGSNAILAQGVCDMTGKFGAFHVGYCGGWSDVTAYNYSGIQEKMQSSKMPLVLHVCFRGYSD